MRINEEKKTLILRKGNYEIEFDPMPIADFLLKIPNVQNLRETFHNCILTQGIMGMLANCPETNDIKNMEIIEALYQCVNRTMDKFRIEEIPFEAYRQAEIDTFQDKPE